MSNDTTDFDPSAFGITIRKKNVEGHWYFSGTVTELPDVEVFEDSYEQAYQEVLNIILDLKQTADEKNRPFPTPQVPSDDYSGRVTLRLNKSLHKRAAHAAEREEVSLNQLLASLIAEGIGRIDSQQVVTAVEVRATSRSTAAIPWLWGGSENVPIQISPSNKPMLYAALLE